MMDLSKLCDELNAFLDAYGLPKESADEVLCVLFEKAPVDRSDLEWLQIAYLENFSKRWNLAENKSPLDRALEALQKGDSPRLRTLGSKAACCRLDEFGVYVWLDDGALFELDINEFEKHGKDYFYAGEVTAPESQDFLDAVNARLGSDFRLDQFAGR